MVFNGRGFKVLPDANIPEATGSLVHGWWECKNGTPTLEDRLVVTLTIQTGSQAPLGIYQKELET